MSCSATDGPGATPPARRVAAGPAGTTLPAVATVFLDLDGTLIDPKTGITSSIRAALREQGVEPPGPDDLAWCIGPPLAESFPALLGPGGDVGRAIAVYRQHFAAGDMFRAVPYDGVTDMLTALRRAGCRLHVATSKPHAAARTILSHFGLDAHLDGVFGSEMDGTRSDKTELLAHAIARTATPPGRAAMLGDRRHDIIGARNCGIRSIGALWGYGADGELEGAGAEALARRPREVPGIVPALLAPAAGQASTSNESGRTC